ncbi:MAG: hypothetical protein K2I80_08905 [Ruminococcus sp.]|nr:hypothetical protein [Ruminococcus sp.]MDE6849087.1 hypothetical protein [Ruminococcus sp.]
MAFCSNCGKVIPDGMICDCQMQEQNSNPPAPKGNNKKQLVVIGISAVTLIVVLCLIISSLGGGYKDPIKDLVKGFNKNDCEKILEATMTKDYLKELKEDIKDEDEKWKDFVDEMNDYLEESKEDLEDDYGKNVKLSVKFLDKKDVKKSDMKKIEERYDDYFDAEVKKAYKVKIEMEIKGKDDEDSEKGWLYVVNIKGDGWKVSTYDDESGLTDLFDF